MNATLNWPTVWSTNQQLTLTAPAKINTFLNVTQPRLDGFHEVVMVMAALNWGDTLTLSPASNASGLTFSCTLPELETPHNLVVQAYHLFYEHTGLSPLPMHVALNKQIPTQAGLGGGSSDAATLLFALNQLAGTQALPLRALCDLAAQLGSDVPFFLYVHTQHPLALATGRGEQLTPLPFHYPHPILLIKPLFIDTPTPWAYDQLRQHNRYHTQTLPHWIHALPTTTKTLSVEDLYTLAYNDFESALFPHYPELAQLHQALNAQGHLTLLSGSGPTLWATSTNFEALTHWTQNHLDPLRWWTHQTTLKP